MGVPEQARREKAQLRQQHLLLEVAQRLVEDQVEAVVGGVGRDVHREAAVDVPLVLGLEQARARPNDAEALLLEHRPERGNLPELGLLGGCEVDLRERRRCRRAGVGSARARRRHRKVEPEGDDRRRDRERRARRGGRGRRRGCRARPSARGCDERDRREQRDRSLERPSHRVRPSMTGSSRPSPSMSAQPGRPGPASTGSGEKPKPRQAQAPVETVEVPFSVE